VGWQSGEEGVVEEGGGEEVGGHLASSRTNPSRRSTHTSSSGMGLTHISSKVRGLDLPGVQLQENKHRKLVEGGSWS
jgi:hypothetical protein